MSGEEWTCGDCGNVNTRRECAKCDARRPQETTALVATKTVGNRPAYCWFDHCQLDDQGWCLRGNGYPVGIVQPTVCPYCRQRLEWLGACFGCYGSETPTDRLTWTFPGARYETHDDNGRPIGDGCHLVKTAEAFRRVCTPAEMKTGFDAVQNILAKAPVMEIIVLDEVPF